MKQSSKETTLFSENARSQKNTLNLGEPLFLPDSQEATPKLNKRVGRPKGAKNKPKNADKSAPVKKLKDISWNRYKVVLPPKRANKRESWRMILDDNNEGTPARQNKKAKENAGKAISRIMIADIIKKKMAGLRLTMDDVAKGINKSKPYIYNLLSGRYNDITLDTAVRLARVLKVKDPLDFYPSEESIDKFLHRVKTRDFLFISNVKLASLPENLPSHSEYKVRNELSTARTVRSFSKFSEAADFFQSLKMDKTLWYCERGVKTLVWFSTTEKNL